MSTQALRTSPGILIHALAAALAAAAHALGAVAARVDARLEARRRAAQDRLDLARMSNRELRDIGLDRGQIDAVADGWSG